MFKNSKSLPTIFNEFMLIEKCAYNLTYNYHDVSYINCTAVFDIGYRSQTRLTLFLNYCHYYELQRKNLKRYYLIFIEIFI